MTQMIDRFWSRVKTGGPDDCWEWQGSRYPYGYGRFVAGGRAVYTHRFALELATGSDPGDKWVLHRCDNPPCVNPAHLFTGTAGDNNRDRHQKGRTFTKVADAQLAEIRQRAMCGESQRKLGREYGVTQTVIHRIVHGLRREVNAS